MISKADLAARAARVSDRRTPAARASEATDEASTVDQVSAVLASPANAAGESPDQVIQPVRRAAPRAKPVRVTADLAPQSYRALLAYSARLAEDLGLAKVPHVEVIRALIVELNTNPALQETIGKYVRAQLSK